MLDFATVTLEDLPLACQQLEEQFLFDINIALQHSTLLVERCRALGATSMARPWLLHARMQWGAGQYGLALKTSDIAGQAIRQEQATDLLADYHLLRGLIQMSLKRNGLAAEEYATAIEIALNQGQISIAIEAFISISQSYGLIGMDEEAEHLLELGHRLAVSINDHKQIGKSAIFLAGNLINRQRYAEALRLLQQAEPSILRHGDTTWIVECGNYMGVCYLQLQQRETAGIFFESMLAMAKAMNALWGMAITSINYARYLLDENQPDAALRVLASARESGKQFDMGFLQRESLQLLSRACKQRGDYGQALQHLRDYEQLMLSLVQVGTAQDGSHSPLQRQRLERIRRRISDVMREFEYMFNLFAPGEASVRGQQLRNRCLRAPATQQLVRLSLYADPRSPELAEQKISGILRLTLALDDLWLRLGQGSYLIYPGRAATGAVGQLCRELEAALNRFPWSWHLLAEPEACATPISPAAALELLQEMRGAYLH
ncbi:hypothetical protein [Chitinilyticum litopenaei]|uniref:hypothetical protein n=1 Tax=Chitinilyticum litopenaei TaxID=1121276 RepID=UPI00048B24FC|nr:hypothetical protein [Chitinilyticum litopenaei]